MTLKGSFGRSQSLVHANHDPGEGFAHHDLLGPFWNPFRVQDTPVQGLLLALLGSKIELLKFCCEV